MPSPTSSATTATGITTAMAVMPAVDSPPELCEELLAPESAAGDELESAAPVRVVPPTTGSVDVTTMTDGVPVPLASDVDIVTSCVI